MTAGPDQANHSIDALLPAEIAEKAEEVGVHKARLDVLSLVALAILAGAFIALGSMFATTVLAGADGVIPFGVSRLLAGIVFGLGLILVVLCGADLSTGNSLVVMAWAAEPDQDEPEAEHDAGQEPAHAERNDAVGAGQDGGGEHRAERKEGDGQESERHQ